MFRSLYAIGVLLSALALISAEEPKKPEPPKPDEKTPAAKVAVEKLKLACIGDSITSGDGLETKETQSYPAQLAKMLGEKYDVKNYGVNAACASTCGPKPYVEQEEYKTALSTKPDVLVLMLGTNDSAEKVWAKPDKIEEGLKTIVKAFKKANPKVKILLLTHPVIEEENWGLQANVVAFGLRPLVLQFGRDEGIETVDVFKAMQGVKNIFLDGVHPDEDGAKIIAKLAHRYVVPPAAKK